MQLPIIDLSVEEIASLDVIDGGNESIITRSRRSGTLYKLFNYDNLYGDYIGDEYDEYYCEYDDEYDDEYDEEDLQELYRNKADKLSTIHDMTNLQYSVLPLSIINSNGEFRGYEMTYDRKDIPLSRACLSVTDRIKALRRIKFILEYYSGRGIVYGDVKSSNILINRLTMAIKFCDIDNIGIGMFGIDALPKVADAFIKENGKMDLTLSMYMYNLLVLEQIAYPGAEYKKILKSLEAGEVPPNFNSEAERVIDGMLNPRVFKGESILQYVKKQVGNYGKNA